MNDEKVFECLFSITDDQAENSEFDGDSDYEDELPSTFSTDKNTSVLRSSSLSQNSSNTSLANSLDFDIMNMSVEILNDESNTSTIEHNIMSTPRTDIPSVDNSVFFFDSSVISLPQKKKKFLSDSH